MGLFNWLFGSKEQGKRAVEPTEYKGYLIYPEPKAEGGQFRIAGRICKELDGEIKEHLFIRSDLLPGEESAKDLMLQKAHTFIDQMGDRMFG
ncbi:HlyU family transcriptional regulator [Enterovibrio norvegicus]|uniref:Transcriptional regulator n=1 Tax=Enterovibrio norvegicus TaxID=188144 RepID=A0A2N7LH28_9GAMM|nr:HlyU family transcriptional regulator [Enterovibrio norvegicus]PML78555.1 transcriptional regulator [Enterovibrio norvegicus]PMN64469.1 transcriptional regulator [Enterovibrio norvegicus]PMN94861.1 transcriptional regulator [Enterovibrio norvegicus]